MDMEKIYKLVNKMLSFDEKYDYYGFHDSLDDIDDICSQWITDIVNDDTEYIINYYLDIFNDAIFEELGQEQQNRLQEIITELKEFSQG